MSFCGERFNLTHRLVISLLLHSSLALPLLLPGLRIAGHPPRERLQIELFGMVSNRQIAEQHKAIQGAPARLRIAASAPEKKVVPAHPAPPAEPRVATKSPDKLQTVTTASPVQVATLEKRTSADVAAPVPASAGSAGAASRAGGEIEQRGESPRAGGTENKTLSYVAKVARQVNAHLIYPKEVRRNGVEGVSWITFTITPAGNIQSNSLRVRKSSGHAGLDSSALRAASMSAPFERPPQELTVSIAVSFNVGRM
jgi:periplasmic protein TonB